MLYFLDTSICIFYMRKSQFKDTIRLRIIQHGLKSIKIPAIVVAELMHGARKSKKAAETLKDTSSFLSNFEIIEFDLPEAIAYGKIRADLERKGMLISYHDMLIAATALAYNATLITNNTQEFSRIDGLKLDDWTL
ncbi:MAG: type II toxin-antitoxin system VapC family toxin [Synergistaceae bacterium]|nr:type II toxin-antitoxin system VapC family toxin [Synergistaceae bacterium]